MPCPDYPGDVTEDLAFKYGIDVVEDLKIQQALRLTHVKDVDSALLYSLKYEAVQQASREGSRNSRTICGQNTGLEPEELKKRILDAARELHPWKCDKTNQNSKTKC